MNAMKFRVYYDEDDPRGDLSQSPWDDQKTKEQLAEEKLKALKEQEAKPLYKLENYFVYLSSALLV